MRILLKCPTRSRPEKIKSTLASYMRLAAHPEKIGVAVSCDADDQTMNNDAMRNEINRILGPCEWKRVFYGNNKTKIEACNANMNEIEYQWDIVVLVSDDMIPQIRGYDDILRNHMMSRFPDTNGILWFNDGFQGNKLNTLCIFGRRMYESFGFLYHPSYKSLFCDTELTDQCKTTHADRCLYVPYCIIRHEHPGTGFSQQMDGLYQKNQKYWNEDMYNYIERKNYTLDMTFLIATIPGREASLQRLVSSIHEKCRQIAPEMKYDIQIAFDNREMSIGKKRQQLLESATGKYLAFIDDDDEITNEYIEDLWHTIRGKFSVMRLRGRIHPYTFTHSVSNKLNASMATGDIFLRPPNHLNPMMTDVAKLISFKDAFRGEDLDWTIRMARSGFLTHEYQSDPSRIHYIYNMGTRVVDPQSLKFQQQTSYDTMLQMVWTPNGPAVPSAVKEKPSAPHIPILRLGPRGFVSK